jgi:DNA-binding NtrC family response regulator
MTADPRINGSVLIVDDEVALARHLKAILEREGYQVSTAHDTADARSTIARIYPDIVLLDLKLPDGDGSELMESLVDVYPETEFIIITAHGSIRSAVESTRKGAADYLTKPFEPDELLLSMRNVMQRRTLGEQVRRLHSPADDGSGRDGTSTWRSPSMQRVRELALLAAEQDGIVLLLGESGTGKDHMARWIHDRSRRASGPFFTINCASLSRDLAESELFGHEPGAFTGTRGRKRGLLELAVNGTLLLNEIGDMDVGMQSKLLTFLDSRSFVRLGGERSIEIDARIFAATNKDLRAEVEAGRFREDLFYRLNVVPVELPPLRERTEDIPGLVGELLARLKVDMGLGAEPVITEDALAVLEDYSWPGNIRELRNVLERALMTSRGRVITATALNLQPGKRNWQISVPFTNGRCIHDVTRTVARKLVLEALRRSSTRQEAARLLGISRHSLAYQMKVLEIDG